MWEAAADYLLFLARFGSRLMTPSACAAQCSAGALQVRCVLPV